MKHVLSWVGPVSILAFLTLLIRASDADREICRWFFDGEGWVGLRSPFLRFVYEAAPAPALAIGVGGLIVGLGSLIVRQLRPYGEAGLFLAAMLVLGPGLIINGVFKPFWPRPRPIQTVAFGGTEQFVPVWNLGTTAGTKSFPCGHASMGFYLMAPAFLLSHKRRWAMLFLGLGLLSGCLIGAIRVMQGAHYPSDVVWSGGMVYLSGLALFDVFQWVHAVANRVEPAVDPLAKSIADPTDSPIEDGTEDIGPILLPFPEGGRRGTSRPTAPARRRAA